MKPHIEKKKIDILFTDIKQRFDSVWLDEAANGIYDSCVILGTSTCFRKETQKLEYAWKQILVDLS